MQKIEFGHIKSHIDDIAIGDRSVKHPVSILEDVPVMIDHYFIQEDFVVLGIEEDSSVPIILGRPFLATTGAIIDVRGGKLLFKIADKRVEFEIFQRDNDQVFGIE